MTSLPYATAPVRFRFPALAALAGRSPLGGRREAVLGTLQVARLVAVAGDANFDPAARAERSAATQSWLAAIALPDQLRAALTDALNAAGNDPDTAADALKRVLDVVSPSLDEPSRSELKALLADSSGRTLRHAGWAEGITVTGARRSTSGDTPAPLASRPRAAG
ncbi:MAG TPA: hypothetical protein VKZ41_05840 [Gemmatimonadales bacterium]|nr:hypothetical protein [Gemmatimonadales bacterium]